MDNEVSFQWLQADQIDQTAYLNALSRDSNSRVYSHPLFLDVLCNQQWGAVIINNYEFICPFPFVKKKGISLVYVPAFVQQLNPIGDKEKLEELLRLNNNWHRFLACIPEKIKYLEWQWNINLSTLPIFIPEKQASAPSPQMSSPQKTSQKKTSPLNTSTLKTSPKNSLFSFYQRSNYTLPLGNSYAALEEKFRNNVKRNLKKAEAQQLQFQTEIPIQEILNLAVYALQFKAPIQKNDQEKIIRVFEQFKQKGMAFSTGIRHPNGQLLAGAGFFEWNKRVYYLVVGNHPNGKTLGASHALLAQTMQWLIEEKGGENIRFDFEGSDLPSLAFFYSSFGAEQETYWRYKINRLPKWIRFLCSFHPRFEHLSR